jgi:hypothetical protein
MEEERRKKKETRRGKSFKYFNFELQMSSKTNILSTLNDTISLDYKK